MDLSRLLHDYPAIRLTEHHASLGSTNDRARELAQQGAPDVTLIVADEQFAGRGRQTRSWYTPPRTALAFSLLTRPAIPARQALRLTMLAGLAVVEGIEQSTGLRLDLKWPNDVVTITTDQLLNTNHPSPTTRKVGGILTECAFQGDTIDYAVVGIGLNVNVDFAQHPELHDIAASLKQLLGREVDRWSVLQAVIAAYLNRVAWLAEAARLREAWAARLMNLQRRIRVSLDDQILEGYAEGVDDDGALLLRTSSGVQRLLSGDVTLHDLN